MREHTTTNNIGEGTKTPLPPARGMCHAYHKRVHVVYMRTVPVGGCGNPYIGTIERGCLEGARTWLQLRSLTMQADGLPSNLSGAATQPSTPAGNAQLGKEEANENSPADHVVPEVKQAQSRT